MVAVANVVLVKRIKLTWLKIDAISDVIKHIILNHNTIQSDLIEEDTVLSILRLQLQMRTTI